MNDMNDMTDMNDITGTTAVTDPADPVGAAAPTRATEPSRTVCPLWEHVAKAGAPEAGAPEADTPDGTSAAPWPGVVVELPFPAPVVADASAPAGPERGTPDRPAAAVTVLRPGRPAAVPTPTGHEYAYRPAAG
ncbi:hypothetical protein [Kitasatospora sp. NPDC086791]|uniref:hypothetical protein n=1 Tax=Kitasatospora sp. NPDC086791 TaxID=3155178 RepID=UPI0034316931